MKKIIAGLIAGSALVISAAATSEEKVGMQNVETPCVSLDYITKVTEEFGELPILRADSVRKEGDQHISHVAVLYINMETKSWTMAEKMNDKTYCIIAVGSGMMPVDKKVREDIQKDRRNKQM